MIWTIWIPLALTILGFFLVGSNSSSILSVFCFLVGVIWLLASCVRVFKDRLRSVVSPEKTNQVSPATSTPAGMATKPAQAFAVPLEQKASALSDSLHHQIPQWVDDRTRTSVVGESHYQKSLAEICKARTSDRDWLKVQATLIPEQTNAFDRMAVAVNVEGQQVGYLSRDDARKFRRLLEKQGIANQVSECEALVRGGRKGRDNVFLAFNVELLFSVHDGELKIKQSPAPPVNPFEKDTLLSELFAHHQDTLRLMLFVAKADGAVRAPEVAVMAQHCSALCNGTIVTPAQVLRLFDKIKAPSATTFTRLYNAMRRERAEEAQKTATVLREIIGTQKSMHPTEQWILQALDRPLPKTRQ